MVDLPVMHDLKLSDKEYNLLVDFIYQKCGINLGDNKKDYRVTKKPCQANTNYSVPNTYEKRQRHQQKSNGYIGKTNIYTADAV